MTTQTMNESPAAQSATPRRRFLLYKMLHIKFIATFAAISLGARVSIGDVRDDELCAYVIEALEIDTNGLSQVVSDDILLKGNVHFLEELTTRKLCDFADFGECRVDFVTDTNSVFACGSINRCDSSALAVREFVLSLAQSSAPLEPRLNTLKRYEGGIGELCYYYGSIDNGPQTNNDVSVIYLIRNGYFVELERAAPDADIVALVRAIDAEICRQSFADNGHIDSKASLATNETDRCGVANKIMNIDVVVEDALTNSVLLYCHNEDVKSSLSAMREKHNVGEGRIADALVRIARRGQDSAKDTREYNFGLKAVACIGTGASDSCLSNLVDDDDSSNF